MAPAEAAAVSREVDARAWLEYAEAEGIVIYDAVHSERTPAMALRERRA